MADENFTKVLFQTEALLFSYGDWLSIHDISQTLQLDSELLLKSVLSELKKKYAEGYSFHIEENDSGKWRMALKDEYSDLVSDLVSGIEIPPKALKVLGVIAYEQPISKTRLSEILGRSVKSEVNYLYRNKFLSYEKRGIGKYYRVTKKFYDYFKIEESEFRDHVNKNITEFLEQPISRDGESESERKETSRGESDEVKVSEEISDSDSGGSGEESYENRSEK
jgi:segregation and condensation protein B